MRYFVVRRSENVYGISVSLKALLALEKKYILYNICTILVQNAYFKVFV